MLILPHSSDAFTLPSKSICASLKQAWGRNEDTKVSAISYSSLQSRMNVVWYSCNTPWLMLYLLGLPSMQAVLSR